MDTGFPFTVWILKGLEVSPLRSWALHILHCVWLCDLAKFSFWTLLLYACFFTDALTRPAKTRALGQSAALKAGKSEMVYTGHKMLASSVQGQP